MLKMILFNRMKGMMMKKKKAARRIKPFDAGAYELFNNGLYRHKAIPDKKKAEKLKRKKVDIREYQPFLLRGIARNKFSIHGGVSMGSAGCIDIPRQTEEFFNEMRKYKRDLILNVHYDTDKLR